MSSPTHSTTSGRYNFTPSRPAPPPPTPLHAAYATSTPSASSRTRSLSSTSIDSATTLCTPGGSPGSGYHRVVRHTSPLNTPLTRPPPRTALSYPTPSPQRERVWYSTPPAELSLFDHRPRQTLLSDLETIFGKKLYFPFLSKRNDNGTTHIRQSSTDSAKSRSVSKLKKEKHISDEEMYWSAAHISQEKPKPTMKKGRGVREGNWI